MRSLLTSEVPPLLGSQWFQAIKCVSPVVNNLQTSICSTFRIVWIDCNIGSHWQSGYTALFKELFAAGKTAEQRWEGAATGRSTNHWRCWGWSQDTYSGVYKTSGCKGKQESEGCLGLIWETLCVPWTASAGLSKILHSVEQQSHI